MPFSRSKFSPIVISIGISVPVITGIATFSPVSSSTITVVFNIELSPYESVALHSILYEPGFLLSIFPLYVTFSAGYNFSFIPNIVSWIAGATYPGKVKKNKFYEKAAAKIPFLGNTLYQKVDPYTGESKSWWEAFNRFVPYISIVRASENELKTEKLGLNKKELRGKYTINNEAFTVTGKDLVALNEAYGKWNAIDLEKFYKNQMQVKIKVNNEYKTLTYNQMTDEQRRTAVNTIMSNNAEIAKIQAWTSQGNKYYASAELYKKLIERKITTNVYRGTKGYSD